MSKTNRFAGLFSFGASRAEDPKKDDDKDKAKPARMDGESDDDYAKRCDEEEKKKDDEAKKASDDEKKKDDDAKAAATASGVSAERERWSTVLASAEANGKGATACSLLADSDLSAAQIIGVLKTTPEPQAEAGLARRMAEQAKITPAPAPGGGASAEAPKPGSAAAIAAQCVAAADKARGIKPAKAA